MLHNRVPRVIPHRVRITGNDFPDSARFLSARLSHR
jgi:hypothetical protein